MGGGTGTGIIVGLGEVSLKKRSTFISPEYKGIYWIRGSAGSLERMDSKAVRDWISSNIFTTHGSGGLFFDGNVMGFIYEEMTERFPNHPRNKDPVRYKLRLNVLSSPPDRELPLGLRDVLESEKYQLE